MPIIEQPKIALTQATRDFEAHREIILQLVTAIGAKRILEFGTDVGDSTRIFSAALQITGGHLWTVDIQDPKWPANCPLPSNVTFIKGDAMKFYIDEKVDILFIDDDHTYPHVLSELQRFGPWVRRGGKILLHDITNEQHGPHVLRSALEWVKVMALPLTILPECHGLGVIEMTKDILIANPQ